MREINIDWIEKMEDGLVKKNPSTKMHLVDGLDATIQSLEKQISEAGKVDSVNGKTGVVVLSAKDIKLGSKTVEQEVNTAKAETKRVEFSELSSIATGKDGETYTKVEWKDKSGKAYATSTLIDNILTVVYTGDNKTIKWKITFDEDGFPFKKELI